MAKLKLEVGRIYRVKLPEGLWRLPQFTQVQYIGCKSNNDLDTLAYFRRNGVVECLDRDRVGGRLEALPGDERCELDANGELVNAEMCLTVHLERKGAGR